VPGVARGKKVKPEVQVHAPQKSEIEPEPAVPPPEHTDEDASPSTEEETESEVSGGSAAYNPETGEINWDCPCLGGMAHGPCGQNFREAFSCFVFSEQEPKGIDCVEKFKAMQDCFREHPEIYGEGACLGRVVDLYS
jgi:intermembrane space import and assembly protein 40